jgi:hypothetical protein
VEVDSPYGLEVVIPLETSTIEAKGNWDELVKKFILKFFPISKVQDLRRQCSISSKEKTKELMKLGIVLTNYLRRPEHGNFL